MDFLIDPYRIRAPLKLTSGLYPVRTMDSMGVALAIVAANLLAIDPQSATASMQIVSGNLQQILLTYNDAEPDPATVSMILLTGGLSEQIVRYDDALPESSGVSMTAISGELFVSLVTYSTAADESSVASMSLTSGALS